MATVTSTSAPMQSISIQEKELNKDILDVNSGGIMVFVSAIFLASFYGWWLIILALIWVISGFIAFIASVVCLFYNSSMGDKIAGLLLALFIGPFYWLFYIYNMNYCNRYY